MITGNTVPLTVLLAVLKALDDVENAPINQPLPDLVRYYAVIAGSKLRIALATQNVEVI